MATYKIKHITQYQYAQSVYDSINQIMLYPINDTFQKVKHVSIKITGNPDIDVFKDKFQNKLGVFSLLEPHDLLEITSCIEVDVKEIKEPKLSLSIEDQWEDLQKMDQDPLVKDFIYNEEYKSKDEVLALVNYLFDKNLSPLDNAKTFSEHIFNNFTYRQGVTSVETEVDEIWQLKAGVCQDFAHFLLIMLRSVQIPSRYVSGYICPLNHELRGDGATHAWVEIFLPTYGWIGIDPTNNCIASDRHVRLAIGRYFSDCTPVKGIFKGNNEHRLAVSVIVENAENSVDSIHHNFFNDTSMNNPAFVSFSSATNFSDNSYQLHKQKQIQMQQQQQQQM
jgi:transglutaminase-like putative cysteine protease